jgi:hypothetical protein
MGVPERNSSLTERRESDEAPGGRDHGRIGRRRTRHGPGLRQTTVKAIIGDKLAPRLPEWYLARKGYEAQQTNGLRRVDQPGNLWEPVPGDHGAHGEFDDRARDWSAQLWATTNRRWLALARFGFGRNLRRLERFKKSAAPPLAAGTYADTGKIHSVSAT